MAFAESSGSAVVVDDSVLAKHQAVSYFSDGQRIERVGVDSVEKLADIAAENLDFP